MKVTIEGLVDELRERVAVLLGTPEGSLVFDRSFGIHIESVDAPPDVAEALLFAEVEEKLARYVPEVQLVDIASQLDMQGNLHVRVVLSLAAESDER